MPFIFYERKMIMKTLELTLKGRDSFDRPVYENNGKLYCDVDPRKHLPANICTKSNNEFDGEPDCPICNDVEVTFTPERDTW